MISIALARWTRVCERARLQSSQPLLPGRNIFPMSVEHKTPQKMNKVGDLDDSPKGPLLTLASSPDFPLLLELRGRFSSCPSIDSFAFSGLTVLDPKSTPSKPLPPLLSNVHGHSKKGEILTVFGFALESLTTLLNLLAGKKHALHQLVLGTPKFTCNDSQDLFSQARVGVVPSQPEHFPTSTVEEEFTFACALRVPVKISQQERRTLVRELLGGLGLDLCAKTQICKLSKSQLKRVAIGVELFSLPNLLLVDQPCTGNNRREDWQAVRLLQTLQQLGMCQVVTTVFQPKDEIFQQVNSHFLMLGRGNDTLIVGNTDQANEFFANRGFFNTKQLSSGDYFLLYSQYGEEINFSLIKVSSSSIGTVGGHGEVQNLPQLELGQSDRPIPAQCLKPTRPLPVQVYWLLKREMLYLVRKPGELLQRVLIVGMIMGLCSVMFTGASNQHLPTYTAALSFSSFTFPILSLSMSNAMNVAGHMSQFKKLMLREQSAGTYHFFPVMLVKTMVEVVLLFGIICEAVGILYTNIGWTGGFMMFVATLFCMVESVMSYAYLFAFACESQFYATLFAALAMIPQMLFMGSFARFNIMPVWLVWINYVCNLTYAMRVLTAVVFDPETCLTPQICADQKAVLASNYIGEGQIGRDLGVMIGFCVFYRIVAFAFYFKALRKVK
ncbi:hypothetical protein BASA81_002737 [Batrachochytrium salamandrivorans]|nr:hypothetical protein BASA81_002737 [Batrachochytrium salamandrivorans]